MSGKFIFFGVCWVKVCYIMYISIWLQQVHLRALYRILSFLLLNLSSFWSEFNEEFICQFCPQLFYIQLHWITHFPNLFNVIFLFNLVIFDWLSCSYIERLDEYIIRTLTSNFVDLLQFRKLLYFITFLCRTVMSFEDEWEAFVKLYFFYPY